MKCNLYSISTDLSLFEERIDNIDGKTPVDEIRSTVTAIKDILNDNPEMTCLCAPQIGKNLRLFVVKTAGSVTGDSKYKVYVNPMIIQKKGLHMSFETNPSFPGKYFIVPRNDVIGLTFQDVTGNNPQAAEFKGVFAEVIQQMVEMLDGVLLTDYALDLDDIGGLEKFNKASKKDKAAVVEMYLKDLAQYNDELAQEMKDNPKLKYFEDTVKFMTGIIDGSIIPTNPVPVEETKEESNDEHVV